MYCANCGSQSADNLAFCKNCGFRTAPVPGNDASIKKLALAAGAVIGVTGLVAFYQIMRELLHSPVSPDTMVILLVAYLIAVASMFAILVRHALRPNAVTTSNPQNYASPSPAQFRGINTAQLQEPAQQPSSVTEHTTRTLAEEPVRRL